MDSDELAIRELVSTWMTATKQGDVDTLLSLMDDDVLFMVPGKEPFGIAEFAANSRQMKDVQIDGTSDIQEIQILGDWAWMRNHLEVTITAPNSAPKVRSGYTLTILRKKPDGAWLLFRDANLLTP
jgi:uncharacterized protein (TIGR02246 family)